MKYRLHILKMKKYVKMINISANQVGDKGVSVGESSQVLISKCNLNNLGVGIAAKDGSSVEMFECSITNTQLAAVMAYKKKSYYDNPKLIVNSSSLNTQTKSIRQKDSLLIIDGELVPHSKIDIDELYRSSFMKK